MPVEPSIVDRAEQPYVGITGTVTMRTFNEIADRMPELIGWLMARGVEPTGAPFFRYHVIDMDRELRVEVGAPVPAGTEGEGEVRASVLPAGRYAIVRHVGHPDELLDVTAELLAWAKREGLRWDMTETDAGERWGCRIEAYHTDPRVEPDPAKWETELAFRLAD